MKTLLSSSILGKPQFRSLICPYSSGSQPVVRVPLVVREGLPDSTRVNSIFFTKAWIHSFLVYVSDVVSKKIFL